MRWVIPFFLFFSIGTASAQHCPWDCSGIVILDWPADKKFNNYQVRLVDSSYKVVFNHNVYEKTESQFSIYEELKKQLNLKISKYSWYEYDTVLNFAAGSPVALYNFCDYHGEDLFIEVKSKKGPSNKNYFKLNEDQKFHLHETKDWQNKTPESFDPKFRMKIRF